MEESISDEVQLLCYWQTNVRKMFQPSSLSIANDEVLSPHQLSAWRFRQSVFSNNLYPGRHGRSNSFMNKCFSVNLFYILILFSSNVMCQGVTVTSGPLNQTIVEGDSARFECVYEGSDRVPSWRINTTIYSNSQLPGEYELDDQDFSLTVQNVPTSLNNTVFQCIIGIYFSEKGYLFVEPIEKNTTDCDQCNPVQMSTSTSEQSANTTFVVTENTAATSENLQRSDKISASLVVIVTVTVSVSLLLCVFVIIGSLLCLKQSSKRRKASTRAADIEVKENEAYVAVENYRKPIRVERNEAYEITNIVPSRSRSPQA